MPDNNITTVIIIGGGLVGSLSASFMAKRGYQVILYEKRDDIRTLEFAPGRSINLALSNRGRKALRFIGIEDEILRNGIPMKGRLLHSESGSTKSIPYDVHTKQCIYSVSRNYLNQRLLDAASKLRNVQLNFNHKLQSCDFTQGTVTILNLKTNEILTKKGDLIIGADGAFSSLRRSIQQTSLFNFSQTYIDHGYLELTIPPKRGYKMQPNHLHIWPRGQFMMIALPNQNNSWTVTLFMPFEIFRNLNNPKNLIQFFEKVFPDSIPLIGEEELVNDFFKSKPSALVSIKCKPYAIANRFLLIGDAAHAMVPFYGQGMNAGFEDCSILNQCLDRCTGNIPEAIQLFSMERVEHAQAICDLAIYNYMEMRDLVARPSYKIRKMLDDFLYKLFPTIWIPLYNSVSFSHMLYGDCLANRAWQNKVIQCFFGVAGATSVGLIGYFIYQLY